ncbi:MAG TPA: SDR family oxidoreductase [Candidatus Saccharimonadales bacterium]|nr:SDR family oxidoreductase [Candidatus Saccharimonadales bacterium]
MNGRPLAGQAALVTGSAKRLGRATALRLAEQGCSVAIHFNKSRTEAESTVAEIERLGGKAIAVQTDLTQVTGIRNLVQTTAHEFGRIDILVNSAANFLHASMTSTTEQIWDTALDTNLKAPFFLAQAAAPYLRRSRGSIVNFADIGGIMGWPGYISHSVSKAGVIMLTKTLAKELAPEIRVNAIAPGTITMPGDPPEWESDYIQRAPLKRTGTPRDVTDTVLFLVQSAFITGQVLLVDGGRTL